MTQPYDVIDATLATAMYAMRTTMATTLDIMPCTVAFSRNMFLNILLVTDWQTIANH